MPIYPRRFLPPRSLRQLVAAGAAVASLAACKELTSIDASFPNVTESATLYTINGSPPGTPTAVNLFSTSIFRADQGFSFDVAFDMNAAGDVLLIPPRQLSSGFSAPYSVGLQVVPGPFEGVASAPKDGYRADSVLTVRKGAIVVVESHDTGNCAYAIKGQSFFSKIVITEVNTDLRQISVTMTVNRNCGFRSFAAGIPKD
jgi:hypothetical protein